MDKFLFGLLAVVAGALNNIQTGANATLGKTLEQPIFAALCVSVAAITVYLIAGFFADLSWQ